MSVGNDEDEEGEGGGIEVDASIGTYFEVPDDGREGSANVLRIKVGSENVGVGGFGVSVLLVQNIKFWQSGILCMSYCMFFIGHFGWQFKRVCAW